MLRLLDILQEGAIQLTSGERSQVEEMLPYIIKIISGKYRGDNMYVVAGYINAISADKTPIKVEIRVGNDLSEKDALGYYQTNDPKNPTDNYIFIQQFRFSPYFKGFSGFDMKATKVFTGDENQGIESLRQILKHELIHAKDPATNQHYLKEPYDSKDASTYYKSWAEFQTMTGQFFEAITTGVDRALELGMNKNQIIGVLNNILEYYSGKPTIFTQDTKDFIQGTGKRNIFQSLIKTATELVAPLKSSISSYVTYIATIKKYNPEGYKEFLKDLYKTIDQAKDKLNNLKEMQYINEAKRFQQLAGIISESTQYESINLFEEVSDDDIEKTLAKIYQIDPSKVDLDKIERGEEPSKEDLKEIIGTVVTIAGLIPPALELVGSTTNWVKQNFSLSDQEKQQLDFINQNIKKKEEEIKQLDKTNDPKEETAKEELEKLIQSRDNLFGTEFGNKMKKWGHKLHHAYVWPIKKLLDGAAWYEKLLGRHQKGPLSKLQDEKYREKIANIMYACIMMTIAGAGAYSHLKHLAGVGPVLTTIADSVKAGKSLADIVKDTLSLI